MENINKELINLVMARLGDSGCCKKIFSENEVASFMKLALLEADKHPEVGKEIIQNALSKIKEYTNGP